ncbi:hypothetical protein N9F34_04145 [Alphaproteobacteria bacterium]|nr:hypothetical protein [Alphaproteobacteria bacterium]
MAFLRRRQSLRTERLSPRRDHIHDHLEMGCRLKKIASRLRLEGSEHSVSYEVIYRYIYRPKVWPRKQRRYPAPPPPNSPGYLLIYLSPPKAFNRF